MIQKIKNYLTTPQPVDFYTLFKTLVGFVHGGIPANEAIMLIAKDQPNPRLREALLEISKDYQNGLKLSSSCTKQKVFPNYIAATIEAGEQSAQLGPVFDKIADTAWQQGEIKNKVNGALLTPKIALVIMIIGVICFAKFLIPQYKELFANANIEMPILIEYYALIVNTAIDNFLIVGLVLFVLIKLGSKFIRDNPLFIDTLRLKIPLYGPLHFQAINQNFSDILSLMLYSSLAMVPALEQAAKITENALMKQQILAIVKEIRQGSPPSKAFEKVNQNIKIFDPILISFLKAGEKAGNTPLLLAESAKISESKIKAMLNGVETKLTLISLTPLAIIMVVFYWMSLMPATSFMNQLTNVGG